MTATAATNIRDRRRRHTAALLCAPLVALLSSATAVAKAPVTTTVAASIAYTDGSKNTVPVWKDIRLTIKLGDQLLVNDQPLPDAALDSVFHAPTLLAVDLDDDTEAEVIVDVFTGGVDCCTRSVVYHRTGVTYTTQVLTWPTTGYRLANVAGSEAPEFVAADARVPAIWNSDARGPVRALGLRNGKISDLSRRATKLLRSDARIHQKALRTLRRKQVGDTRPIIAAYAADLVRLGQAGEARRAIAVAARRHELRGSAKRFARTLDRAFKRWGISKRRQLSS
ncbi:MAG: hypothetical protein QM679_00180 [Patulibacter sp.]